MNADDIDFPVGIKLCLFVSDTRSSCRSAERHLLHRSRPFWFEGQDRCRDWHAHICIEDREERHTETALITNGALSIVSLHLWDEKHSSVDKIQMGEDTLCIVPRLCC